MPEVARFPLYPVSVAPCRHGCMYHKFRFLGPDMWLAQDLHIFDKWTLHVMLFVMLQAYFSRRCMRGV